MTGAPDKSSAIFLSQGSAGPGGLCALLEHDLVMLSWLVVVALPIISIEGDLEEITYLSLPLFFILSLKMDDNALAFYPPKRNFLRKWAISSWTKGALYSKKLE